MTSTPEIVIGMADMKTGKAPQVLTTVLGSCVGLCLYSPRDKVGGLLHIMLPSAGNLISSPDLKKAKFADTGVPELLQSLCTTLNTRPSDLVAKIFGGAKVLQGVQRNIGQENIEAVRSILKAKAVPLKAACVGGDRGYRIKFNLETGKVVCQIFGNQPEEF